MHVLLHSTLSLSIYRKSQKHAAAYEQVSKQAWVETKNILTYLFYIGWKF